MRKLKSALVDSYIGAIALGYLLAEAVLYFIAVFSTPVAYWVIQKRPAPLASNPSAMTFPLFWNALPSFINFVVLLLTWYLLMCWLYLGSSKEDAPAPPTNQS